MMLDIIQSVLGALIFSTLPLRHKGYLSAREQDAWFCVLYGLYAVCNVVEGDRIWATFAGAISIIAYLAWKYLDKDDDDPRKKRKKALSGVGKRLPKPTLVQVRPVGAT